MNLRFGENILLWLVWIGFAGILYYLGETQFYMSYLTPFIGLLAALSLALVVVFRAVCRRSKRNDPMTKGPA